MEGIASREQKFLTTILLDGSFSNDIIIAVAMNCPNLKVLSLSTIAFFSECLFPLIFDRLRNLDYLHISSLHLETDIHLFEPFEIENNLKYPDFDRHADVSNLKKLKSFSIFGLFKSPEISLGKLSQLSELLYVEYFSYSQVIYIILLNTFLYYIF